MKTIPRGVIRILGFVARAIAATAICVFYMYAVTIPFAKWPGPPEVLHAAVYLDYPVGWLNSILPMTWKTPMSLTSWKGTYSFPEPFSVELRKYLQVGVPAYILLLYVPAAVMATVRRIQTGREQTPAV